MQEQTLQHQPTIHAGEGGKVALVASKVCKSFGGLQVLKDVSLFCEKGEIVGLIGPNGAGKSTLINAMSSLMAVDAGEVTLGGTAIHNSTPQLCASRGVARTFQNIKLFNRLTVRQNVEVTMTTCRRDRPDRARAIDVDELLRSFGLTDVADWKAGALSYGNQRRLEIARALALGPDFLLLDEPAAGMNAAETTALINAVQGTRDRFGCGVIVIDHDLRFIMTMCERIYVLDMGQVVASGTPDVVRRNPRVIEVYIGHDRARKNNG